LLHEEVAGWLTGAQPEPAVAGLSAAALAAQV
jgi:hypothetical protein